MLDKLTCRQDQTLFEALRVINTNALGAAFVVDAHQKLLGILTDGDIRRLLLDGYGLETPIQGHTSEEFIYAFDTDDIKTVLYKTSEKIKIIPIVTKDFVLVDFAQYDRKIHLPVATPNLQGNEFNYLIDAFLSTWISSSGEYINRFEEDFASYCGVEHGVAVSNGTVALHLALVALGVGKGDEVIVPDFTFAATINAVLHAGATPVIVDIETDGWCISPSEIEKAVTGRTKAIIPVHIYGQPCDMDAIIEIADNKGLYIIEDCAEAHGATFKGQRVGSFGHINCFSFYGNKIITTGEGGMCLTNSASLNERMRVLRDHGMNKSKRYWHDHVGFNYRMTNLQAAIGVAQLERIDQILEKKQKIEDDYRSLLKDVPFIEFQSTSIENSKKITWLVSISVKGQSRDQVINLLQNKGIDARPFFYPLSAMEIYKPYVFSNSNCIKVSSSGINLPSSEFLEEKTALGIQEVFNSL